MVFRVKTLTNPQNASGETGFTVPPLCFSAVKVLLVRRLLFAAFLPQNTVNTLPYLLRFLYLVFQCEIAAGQLLPLGGQLLLLRFLRSLSVCGVPNGCMHEKTGVLFPRSFIFDFLYCFCCGGDNRQILVVHAVKQCFKLPPLCGLICFLVWEKELVY